MSPRLIANAMARRHAPWVLLIVFLVPVLAGLTGRMLKPTNWFPNYQATECAGLHAAHDEPYYDPHLACAGLHPSVYVYHPAVAEAAEELIEAGGQSLLRAVYFTAYGAALFALGWLAWFSRAVPGLRLKRVAFAGLIPANAIFVGNVAIMVHALAGLTALVFETRPALFLISTMLAGTVKPVFLTYLAVIVLAPWPLRRRVAWVALGLAGGLAPTAWFLATGGADAAAWRVVLDHAVTAFQPGIGFLGWAQFLGFNLHGPGVLAAFALYAGAIVLAALQVAAATGLDGRQRVWLGITLAALLNPRLMHQDILLLGPGMLVLARAGVRIAPACGQRLFQAMLGACVITAALTLIGNRLVEDAAIITFAGLLFYVALRSLRLHGPRALDELAWGRRHAPAA